jgi:uncharacterized protein (TIGR00255 family)
MPLRSMTGFGTAEGPVAGGRLRVEVRSVNHRHLVVQVRVPSELGHLEADIRERLRRHLERGSVSVSARWSEEPPAAAAVEVDVPRARAVVDALREVGRTLGIAGDVDYATLARIPDVVRVKPADTAVEAPDVLAVLDAAAQACVAMRAREGLALADDLLERLASLASLAERVSARGPERLAAEQERLRRNVAELAQGVAVDPARLAQEVAFMADRLDVTEELVRLRTHLAAASQALGEPKSAGRQLGFVLQELGREVNTIGSKANDAAIAVAVIAMKGELEKMREQVENLE